MTTTPRPSVLLLAALMTGLLACSALTRPGPALALSDDPVLRRMDAVLEENSQLREDAWKLHKSGNREAARQAAEALTASEERLERTRVEALAHVAGISPAQVEALRKEGKSWGQASGELGVHPGFLGIGKTPLYESGSVRKAKSSRLAKSKKAHSKGNKPAVKKLKSAASKPKATSAKKSIIKRKKSRDSQ